MIVPTITKKNESPIPSVRLIARRPAIGARNQFQLCETTKPVTGTESRTIRQHANINAMMVPYSFSVDITISESGYGKQMVVSNG
jgi:hypothetical protein